MNSRIVFSTADLVQVCYNVHIIIPKGLVEGNVDLQKVNHFMLVQGNFFNEGQLWSELDKPVLQLSNTEGEDCVRCAVPFSSSGDGTDTVISPLYFHNGCLQDQPSVILNQKSIRYASRNSIIAFRVIDDRCVD